MFIESTENDNTVSRPQFVIYRLCPWWALQHCQDRPISITGRVTFTYQSFIILQMDSTHKKEIKVQVRPFGVKYTYSDQQYRKIQSSKNYSKLKRIVDRGEQQQQEGQARLENELQQYSDQMDIQEEIDPKIQQKRQSKPMQFQGEGENPKVINGKHFKVGSLLEVRGRFVEPHGFIMQQFTLLDSSLDLNDYNEMLQIITDKLQHVYY